MSLALLKSKRCLGDPYSAVLLPYATSRTSARSLLQYVLSTASATLSLNVQSFQTTTFNGGCRIYGTPPWHPSCRSLVHSSCSLYASASLFAGLHHGRSWRSKKRWSPRIGSARRSKQFYGSAMVRGILFVGVVWCVPIIVTFQNSDLL